MQEQNSPAVRDPAAEGTQTRNAASSHRILRLLKPGRTGLVRLIFSRTPLILFLILLQLLIVISFFDSLQQYANYYSIGRALLTVGMVLYLFSSSMDSSAKLTWLFLIALVPFPAALFLAYTKLDIGHRAMKQRMAQITEETRHILPKDRQVLRHLEEDHSGTDDLCRYLNRTGCFPICEHSQAEYYPLGDSAFEPMLEALRSAEKFIFLEFFIVDEGEMWGSILEILAEKAAQGVEVRLLYDGMNELFLLPRDYPKRLARLGIDCRVFSPLRPLFSTYYNYRDHRKILVVDGKTAFTGGVNLADEYINRKEVYGHWKDTALRITGEAVRPFTLMFLQMWHETDEEADPEEAASYVPYLEAPLSVPEEPSGFVMPYGDCPLDRDKVGESVYIDILNRATEYVHIMTPYLILDDEMLHALRFAAERGVDVRLILPGIPDKKLAYALAKSYYRTLLRAGVKIYEYAPGFVHAKVFVSDNVKAVVGTINLDYRSLYHHFECAAYLYRCACVPRIEEDFLDTLKKCRTVTPESMRREKLFYKIMGPVMRLIAPLM